jgi:thioredoxin-related protein
MLISTTPQAFRTKFVKLAAHYNEAIFCEILGDRSESTRNLMRSLKVRATPTFVFFRNGENIHMHSGISGEKMVDALKVAVKPEEAGFCEEVKFAASLLAAAEEEAH